MMFHKHRWVTTGVKFTPGVAYRTIEGRDADAMLAAMVGFTNVTQTCRSCGWMETTRHVGQVEVEVAETAHLMEAPR